VSAPSRLALADAVLARLRGDWLKVYLGEIPDTDPPKVLTLNGVRDPSGRVAAYAVLHPGAGTPTPEVDLGDSSVDLDWGCQVTVAAGFDRDLLAAADFVHARLFRWRPSGLDGFHTDGLVPPPGFTPGFPRDSPPSVQPPRLSLPLQYRLTATA
jgi:hypothetical protein